LPIIDPNLVEPVILLTLDVTVCTTNVCAVIVPAVKKPEPVIGPVDVMLPVSVKEPDITGGACIDIEPVNIALCITILLFMF
jgi:hypothetical protein